MAAGKGNGMASTGQKWLMGCGIGCLTLVILAVLSIYGGTYCVRNLVKDFDQAEKADKELASRYGAIDDYTPPLDGVPAPARLEAFLAVRDTLGRYREELADKFASFRRLETGRKDVLSVLGAVKGGITIAPLLGGMFAARSAALADHGMGMGEYIYIYCLAYFSFLGRDPRQIPADMSSDHVQGSDDLRERVHRHMARLLGNLQAALDEQAPAAAAAGGGRAGAGQPGGRDPGAAARADFRASLDRELGLLLTDPGRVPWQDGLPPAIEAALAPYRDRLERTYDPALNLFELGATYRRGRTIEFGN